MAEPLPEALEIQRSLAAGMVHASPDSLAPSASQASVVHPEPSNPLTWQRLRLSQTVCASSQHSRPRQRPPLSDTPGVQWASFTGQTGEYFRVWIVNTFLVLITLGLWSPWAKIRKRQFFLRHTWIAGGNFDFHAQPWPILRGRLIASAVFVTYWFTGNINPKYAAWLALVVALLAPWFVVNSLRFNLANTSYRNVRFAFNGRLIDGVRALLPLVIVAALTLVFPPSFAGYSFSWTGLKVFLPTLALSMLYPYIVGAYRLMLLNKARYGATPLECRARLRTVYAIYARALLLAIGLAIALAIIVGLCIVVLQPGAGATAPKPWSAVSIAVGTLILVSVACALTLLYSYVQSRVVNATLNLTWVSVNVPVHSALPMRALSRIYLLNIIAVVVSCGLLIPWAAVRVARLRVECMGIGGNAHINEFASSATAAGDATNDAASEFFSLDIAL